RPPPPWRASSDPGTSNAPGSRGRATRRTRAGAARAATDAPPGRRTPPECSSATRAAVAALLLAEQRLERIEPGIPEGAVMCQPAHRLAQRGGVQAQPVLTPADRACHQARALQDLHVLGHAVEADRETPGQRPDVRVAAGEHGENSAPRGIRDRTVHSIQEGLAGSARPCSIQPIGRILAAPLARRYPRHGAKTIWLSRRAAPPATPWCRATSGSRRASAFSRRKRPSRASATR